jgi:oligopeptide transport system permease protein
MTQKNEPKRDSLTNEFNQTMKPVSLWTDAWRRLKKNRMAFAGLILIGVFGFLCFAAPILPIHANAEQVTEHQNLPPSSRPAGRVMIETRTAYFKQVMESENRTDFNDEEKAQIAGMEQEVLTNPTHQRIYLLGTDSLGRDMLARALYGGRISIGIGIIGTLFSMFMGIALGSISGYVGGRIDNLLMRFVDVLYGLPYMLVVIILMALFGKNIFNLFIAIAAISWLTLCRVVRGQIISLKNAEFVEAARSMGASTPRIIFRHLTPNTLGVIVVFSTLMVPQFIMQESFLSFLGLGVSAPMASWGSLVAEGANVMDLYPWQLLVPALSMTVFLFAMNFLGDGLRDALDPQSKNKL